MYLLFGEDVSGRALLYVGETDEIRERIRTHDAKKDWWSRAVFVTSAEGGSLNKAHVKYLEARLVERAQSVAKVKLDNVNCPSLPELGEAAQANMENFLDYLHIVLPALGIDCFTDDRRPKAVEISRGRSESSSTLFVLATPKHGLSATAALIDGKFIVKAGSLARGSWAGATTSDSTYGRLFRELVQTGVLRPLGAHNVFADDYAFASPSAAAAVINGRPSNGTLAWRRQGTGQTYKEWEAETLDLNLADYVYESSLADALQAEDERLNDAAAS
ncbi:GIY-YIG nuclease family protein [Cognatilysobacter segetis]|uniref:GIY-YIG nuclease family protein n=1 Tax=Cognatilysobacter segetis TaxID=2492394 RepID=UPI00192E3EA8|nr:GIY-YIG nuclease family protein [Lysobacter segetis]